jgi:hypothetical protein
MRKRDELHRGCMAKAGDEEMTFVLLSRDRCAASTIRFWIHHRIKSGQNAADDPQILEALQCAEVMEAERGLHRVPMTDEQKVTGVCPLAKLYGGNHGKVWIVDEANGEMLSDVCYQGTREQRRLLAWEQAAYRLKL